MDADQAVDDPPCRTGCPLCTGFPALAGAMRWRPTDPEMQEVILETWMG